MPEQLTLRLRKPGVILLTGDPPACEAVRAALEALKGVDRRVTCDVWVFGDASPKLREAIAEHDGEVWDVIHPPNLPDWRLRGPHGFVAERTPDAAVAKMLEAA